MVVLRLVDNRHCILGPAALVPEGRHRETQRACLAEPRGPEGLGRHESRIDCFVRPYWFLGGLVQQLRCWGASGLLL